MPSSISSSEPGRIDEPTYVRPLPALRFGVAAMLALVLFAGALAAWETYWRAWGAQPAWYNSDGQWARERRRIDEGEGGKTVLIGASRVLFDVQLDVWERLSGERPIQLALEGTTPTPVMQDLADDPDFTGLLVVGVAPDVFFSGFAYRGKAFKYREQTPAQRSGTWLSMRFVEPWFAFFDEDFALMKVLGRQAWPARTGVPRYADVRKLAETGFDRDTHMWSKLETDPEYAAMAQQIWAQFFDVPPEGGPDAALKQRLEQIDLAVAAVKKLQARGVEVVFVRPPSNGGYLAYEERDFPRAPTWDVLLARAGAPGVHFQDDPQMQGLALPEWSHLSRTDAERYTESLYRAVQAVRPKKGPE
jgi:hypothetical protein